MLGELALNHGRGLPATSLNDRGDPLRSESGAIWEETHGIVRQWRREVNSVLLPEAS